MNETLILIDIEGTDASGKETQSVMLTQALKDRNLDAVDVHFPRYGLRSATLVEDYLAGAFGADPDEVSPYAASMFYAVDRYAAFHDVSRNLTRPEPGRSRIIVADRYTMSNAVHQCAKLPREKHRDMMEWLMDLEFKYLGQPRPDLVLFLDADPDVVQKMLRQRDGDHALKAGIHHDIHERNPEYMRRSRDTGLALAKDYGWTVVPVTDADGFRDVNAIASEILGHALRVIKDLGAD